MAENSTIEWTTHTFNPWLGCTKVSPGCQNCYAEALMDKRYGKVKWGKGQPRKLTSDSNWKQPIKWNRAALNAKCGDCDPCIAGQPCAIGARPRVFCASLADWLDGEVHIEWLARLLKLIHDTPNLDWLLLTKRPENFFERFKGVVGHFCRGQKGNSAIAGMSDWSFDWAGGYNMPKNVWIGTTVEDQKRADERIPELLEIPARIRFLSVEPMLEGIDFRWLIGCDDFGPLEYKEGIHWAIFGGESGPGARPLDVEWIRDGVRQCKAAGVRAFVKQLGARPYQSPERDGATGYQLQIKDKKGGDWSEWPEDLRIREFPLTPSDRPEPQCLSREADKMNIGRGDI